MKTLQVLAWVLFPFGLLLLLTHFYGGTWCMLAAWVLMVAHAIFYLVKDRKANWHLTVFHFACAFFTGYAIFRVKQWPWSSFLFIIASVFSVAYFFLLLKKERTFRLPQIFLASYFLASLYLFFTPSYKVFYGVHLNSFFNKERRKFNYESWDRYSWFLYRADKATEALAANEEARQANQSYLQTTRDSQVIEDSLILAQHRKRIENHDWQSFH